MPTLVIVESPTKARTIRNYLPSGYRVEASMGHIRDLPESAAGFPSGPAFLERMRKAGYGTLVWKPLSFGIASLYKGYA